MATRAKVELQRFSVDDAISAGFGDLTELGEELRNWYDSLPENLQGGDKGSTVDEGASTLENLNEPDVDSDLSKALEVKGVDVQVYPLKKRASRADRRDYAVGLLSGAKDALEEFNEDGENDEAKQLVDDLDELISEAEAVEFPGMYG